MDNAKNHHSVGDLKNGLHELVNHLILFFFH